MESKKITYPEIESQCAKRLPKKLITAVTDNNVAQLQSLQESVLGVDENGNTLLHVAIQTQKMDAFVYLLSLDEIPLNARNDMGNTPLMEAFGNKEDSQNYAVKLIEAGCEITEPFPDGNTALHLTIYKGWPEVAELLIEMGHDVDCQNSEGETPLHYACRLGCVDDIWRLLFYGADPNFTYMTESIYTNFDTFTLINCYDIVISQRSDVQEIFFTHLKNDVSFSLMTFIETMEYDFHGTFPKLMELSCDIHYTYDDLKSFSQRIALFSPEKFQLFLGEFGYVIEDMFERCCLDDFFICEDPLYLDSFLKNLFVLLESDIGSSFVETINSSRLPLLQILIDNFVNVPNKLDLLTQVVCVFLSYGVDVTAETINEVYYSFGYCNLFKIMLHMDIKNINRFLHTNTMPRIIYDVDMRIGWPMHFRDEGFALYNLWKYFTLPQNETISTFPTLVELARNVSRDFIIEKFKIKNSMQFYTVLKLLPIAEIHKKIIAFEKQLYSLR